MTALDELRERLERAEGPDEELSIDIVAALLGWRWEKAPPSDDFGPSARIRWYNKDGMFCGLDDEPLNELGHVTASLDAAIALVKAKLPGWGWTVKGCGDESAFACFWNPNDMCECCYTSGKSPAIALLLALLSALEKESAE